MAADTKQEKKEAALAALAQSREDLERLEAQTHDVRERRNRLLYEASKLGATITECANSANVAHSFASRTIRGKGKPGSGSRT